MCLMGFQCEDGGCNGKSRVGTDIDARDCLIGQNENSSDGVDVLLDLIHNYLLVGLVLPSTGAVGQPSVSRMRTLGGCYACSPHPQYPHLPLYRPYS